MTRAEAGSQNQSVSHDRHRGARIRFFVTSSSHIRRPEASPGRISGVAIKRGQASQTVGFASRTISRIMGGACGTSVGSSHSLVAAAGRERRNADGRQQAESPRFRVRYALAAAGAALGLTAVKTVYAGNPTNEDTSKIPSYNTEMEYRRCGKTNMMTSAVCLEGTGNASTKCCLPRLAVKAGWAWAPAIPSLTRTATKWSAAASTAASTISTLAGATK